MIGIIAAMNVEMESLRSYIENPVTETVSGITFVSGMLEGKEVVTAGCGIGKVFAAMCAQTMILRYKPDCIVNTGVAGTLTDKLTIGSIAVSSAVVQHDMDTSALGDPVGMISGINKVLLPASEDLCDQLSACATVLGIRTETGVIASGDQFISSRPSAQSLARWRALPSVRSAMSTACRSVYCAPFPTARTALPTWIIRPSWAWPPSRASSCCARS